MKREKLDFSKIENFCVAKDTIKKVNRQRTKQEKIFINYVSDKGPVLEYIKNFYNLII